MQAASDHFPDFAMQFKWPQSLPFSRFVAEHRNGAPNKHMNLHLALLFVKTKTFTPFGVPGCKPGATLVPKTRVAAAQHVYSFQAEPVPT